MVGKSGDVVSPSTKRSPRLSKNEMNPVSLPEPPSNVENSSREPERSSLVTNVSVVAAARLALVSAPVVGKSGEFVAR